MSRPAVERPLHRGVRIPIGTEAVPAAGGRTVRAVLVALVLAAAAMARAPEAGAAVNPLRCDFDGDGRSDLAVGVPGDNKGRGAVNVQYSPDGFLGKAAYLLRPTTVPGSSGAGQRLGSALACGDFDGDGFADLAIGIPGESADRGAVVVLYGSAAGLADTFGIYFDEDGLPGQSAAPGDRFGEALVAGDFDGDGVDDLAIGAPGKSVLPQSPPGPPIAAAGAVHVVFGSMNGLVPGTAQTFTPATPGSCCIAGAAHYGAALAAGDFDADGIADLAIGAPQSDAGAVGQPVHGAGAVHLLRGQAGTGLTLAGQLHVDQSFLGGNKPRAGEYFGFALAAGSFSGGAGDDLAIGVPFEQLDRSFKEAFRGFGAVHVLYFAGPGLFPTFQQLFVADGTGGLGDGLGSTDMFGWALAAGNFDGQHGDDLAIGSPYNRESGNGGGAVAVLYSDGAVLSLTRLQFFFPGDLADFIQTPAPPRGVLDADLPAFGGSLAVGDYQGDGVADLFIGVPAYSFEASLTGAGAVEIKPGVHGSGLGVSYLLLHQNLYQPGQTWAAEETDFTFSADGPPVTGERFGYAMGR
jgi:hypothetical protein